MYYDDHNLPINYSRSYIGIYDFILYKYILGTQESVVLNISEF